MQAGCLRSQSIYKIKILKKLKDILFGIQNTIPVYDYFWAYHIIKFVKKHSLDVIHVHDLYLAKAGWLAKKKTNVKMILDLHENYPAAVMNYKWTQHPLKKHLAKPQKWSKIEGKLLSYPDRIIVTNEYYKRFLINNYPPPESTEASSGTTWGGQILVYENVPDVKELLNYPIDKGIFPKNDKFILFYFGGISKRRGILTAIKAHKKLLPSYPFLHLLLIGPIDKAEITLFEQTSNITHYPWKDISLLPSYLSISDVCLCPLEKNEQHDTCFANKILQYALFSKPIIVSDCKPQEDFIKEHNCGLVFQSNNVDDLAVKIEYLINNPEKCTELGLNGKNAVESDFNTDSMKERLYEAYE